MSRCTCDRVPNPCPACEHVVEEWVWADQYGRDTEVSDGPWNWIGGAA